MGSAASVGAGGLVVGGGANRAPGIRYGVCAARCRGAGLRDGDCARGGVVGERSGVSIGGVHARSGSGREWKVGVVERSGLTTCSTYSTPQCIRYMGTRSWFVNIKS